MGDRRPLPLVLLEDVGADAVFVPDGGPGVLILRPAQSLTSAVSAAQAALPLHDPGEVATLVRMHMPDTPSLDSLVGLAVSDDGPPPKRRRWRRTFMLALSTALTVALAAGVGGAVAEIHHEPEPHLFAGEPVQELLDVLGYHCNPIDEDAAHCHTGEDDALGKAYVNEFGVMYRFDHGYDETIVALFTDAEYAAEWYREWPRRGELLDRVYVWDGDSLNSTTVLSRVVESECVDTLLAHAGA